MDRRAFFKTSVATATALAAGAAHVRAEVVAGTDGYDYEFSQSDEDWLRQLGEHDFNILRLGTTEVPKSSELWDEVREGEYHCKGCGLNNYSSSWKVELDKGWAFFRQSVPNSLMMSIDWPRGIESGMGLDELAAIEVHCRRCGSHMGHILLVDGVILHCINGASLVFDVGAG